MDSQPHERIKKKIQTKSITDIIKKKKTKLKPQLFGSASTN